MARRSLPRGPLPDTEFHSPTATCKAMERALLAAVANATPRSRCYGYGEDYRALTAVRWKRHESYAWFRVPGAARRPFAAALEAEADGLPDGLARDLGTAAWVLRGAIV